jgi:hypothetical protein
MWWLVLVLAQVQAPEPGLPPKRPNQILGLLDQARGLAPEFSADTLLRLAGSRLISETKWKRELIEEAFRSSSHAQLPYKRRGGVHTDTRPSHEAWDNGLEALTLQTRAVGAMIPLDPLRARAMYEEIVLPDLPNPTCQDVLTPNVDAWYETALRVLERGYTDKERQKGEPLHLLESKVQTMQAPEQAPAVGKLILDAKVSPAERQQLLTGFAVALDRVKGSDRVYAPTEFELLRTLSSVLRAGYNINALMPAMRNYIVRQVSGPRCTENLSGKGPGNSVRDFNAVVDRLNASGADYKRISPEESKPLKDDGAYKLDNFWQSARSKQVLDALKWLNHGNRDLPGDKRFWTLEERSTMEWNSHYVDTLKLIEGWKEDEEPSPEDYFAMKAQVYMLLAQLVPPGKARDNALGTYRVFLEQSYFLIENHNFWFTDVRFMLDNARRARDSGDKDWMLDELTRSANPVIALYAQLEKLIPAK